MRRKGFTLVELLVVIAIIALLMGILMPALARVRQLAFRMTCGSNLSGIGKAMLLYANDYDDELPRAAGRNSTWAPVKWDALTRQLAYAPFNADGTGGNATITSCLYLLVKYAEVTPKSFLCKGDSTVSEFVLPTDQQVILELTQAWDFGPTPATRCSYTYHSPWGQFALTSTSDPGVAVAADKNPWQSGKTSFTNPSDTKIVFNGKTGDSACQMYGNSSMHQDDGQNVMFMDTHVAFEKRAYCSLEEDNIYTTSNFQDKGDPAGLIQFATTTTAAAAAPKNRKDSVLVNDGNFSNSGTATRGS